MANVRETWRTERLSAAAYDRAIERERVARAFGAFLWSTDTRRLYAQIAELGSVPDGTDVLDVPCGGGVAFRGLRPEQRLRWIAADISPYMLGRARAHAERRGLAGIEFVEADALALPFADASFDLCVSFNGLHCLPSQPPALAEMARVLRPGGRLSGTAIVEGAGARPAAAIRFMRAMSWFGETCTAAQLEARIGAAGFADVQLDASGALARFSARRPAA